MRYKIDTLHFKINVILKLHGCHQKIWGINIFEGVKFEFFHAQMLILLMTFVVLWSALTCLEIYSSHLFYGSKCSQPRLYYSCTTQLFLLNLVQICHGYTQLAIPAQGSLMNQWRIFCHVQDDL